MKITAADGKQHDMLWNPKNGWVDAKGDPIKLNTWEKLPDTGEKTLEMALLKKTRMILDEWKDRFWELHFFGGALTRWEVFEGFDIRDLDITGEELLINLEEYEKEKV